MFFLQIKILEANKQLAKQKYYANVLNDFFMTALKQCLGICLCNHVKNHFIMESIQTDDGKMHSSKMTIAKRVEFNREIEWNGICKCHSSAWHLCVCV